MVAHPQIVREALRTEIIAAGIVVVGLGCASGPKGSMTPATSDFPRAPSSSNIADANPIVVRMASKDEFPHEPPHVAEGGRRIIRMGCETRGSQVNAYSQPVIAFAREHLLGNVRVPVHESTSVPGTPKPKLGDGVNIVVEPRETLGELRIVSVGPPFYAPGESWAGTIYCLHVRQHDGITTIAVEQASSWIR
jgi:hypothetical protein